MDWISVFDDTATFANYIRRIQKVGFYVASSTSWLTPAVSPVSNGLMKCRDTSFRFHNFVRIRILLRLIRRESIQSELDQACLLSLLSSFRVPSETLQMWRSYTGDKFLGFSPQREKALVGVRMEDGADFLVA